MTSARSRSWRCYSAAGAPADAKAITRLVPRRDNAETGELRAPNPWQSRRRAAVTRGTSWVRYVVKGEWDWNEAGGGRGSARFDYVLQSSELADLVLHRLLHHWSD